MKFKLVFKYIFSFLVIISTACSEIERDNILDPKNTSSKRESILLVEAFINTSDGVPSSYTYNYDALEAIDSLSDIYDDRFIWLEYHWNTSTPDKYTDDLTVTQGEVHYKKYTTDYDPARSKGVPDIFINGAVNRVQGASEVSNVIKRVQDIASELILNNSDYTIEAEFDVLANQVEGTYRIARLGNSRSDKLQMRIISTEDNNDIGKGKRTVQAIAFPESIDRIEAGEFFEKEFNLQIEGFNPDKIIFILMDESGFKVLHAIEKEL